MKETQHKERLAALHKWAAMGVNPFVFYCNYHDLSDDERKRMQTRFYNWWNGRIKDFPTLEKFESMVEKLKWE